MGELTSHQPLTDIRPSNKSLQYGLQTAFSEIERKSHSVTSAGNPIEMDMTTMYKVKGIGKETTITSKVNIFHEGGKITRVEDKWDGKLPDSGIANVSKPWTNLVNPLFWTNYWFGWSYSLLVYVHDHWWWMVRRLCDFFRFRIALHCNLSTLPLLANTTHEFT